jgi:hypothetical protein
LNGTCTYSDFQEQEDPLFCHNYTSEVDCGGIYDVTGTNKCEWYDNAGGMKQCYNTSGGFDSECANAFLEDECNQTAGCSYRHMSGYQSDFTCMKRQLTREESCDRFSYGSLCDEQPFCKYVEVFNAGGSGSDGGFLGSGMIDVTCGTATTLQKCNAIKTPDGKQACTYTSIDSNICTLNGSYWGSPDGLDFNNPPPECATKNSEQDCLAESDYCKFSRNTFGSCSVAAHPCTLLKTEEDCKADDACQYHRPNKGQCQENITNFENSLECRCLGTNAAEHWDEDLCLSKGCSYFEGAAEGNGNVCTQKQDNDNVDPSCIGGGNYGDDSTGSDDLTSNCFTKRTQETCSATATKACDWVIPQSTQTCEGNDNCLFATFVEETGKLNVTDCLSRSGCSVQSQPAGDGYCIERNPCAGKSSSADCSIIEGCRWDNGFCSVELDDVAFCTDNSCCMSVFGDGMKDDCNDKKYADGSQACMYLEGTGIGTCLAIGDAYCDLVAVYDKEEETGSLKSACNSFDNCTFSTGAGIGGTCSPYDKCASYSLGNCDNTDGGCETSCKATSNCSWVEDVETCVKSGFENGGEEGQEGEQECFVFFTEISCSSASKAEGDENPRCAWVNNVCIDYEKCRSNEAQQDELSCNELGCLWELGFCRSPIDNINGQGDFKCVPEDSITQAPEVTFTTATTTTTLVHGCCVILIAGKAPSCKYEDVEECARAEADLIFVPGTSTAEFKENKQCNQVTECTTTTAPPVTTQPPTLAPVVDRVIIQLVDAYVLGDQTYFAERDLFEELVDILGLNLKSWEVSTVRGLSLSFSNGNIVVDMREVPLQNKPLAANLKSTVQDIDNNPPRIKTTLAILNNVGIQGTTQNTLIKEAISCAPGKSCLVNPKPTEAPIVTTVTPAPTAAATTTSQVTEKPVVTFKNVEGVYLGNTQALYSDLLESIETANDALYVSVTKQLDDIVPQQLDQLEKSLGDAIDNVLAAREAGADDSEFVQQRDDINKNIDILNDILKLARGTTTKKPTTTTVTTTTEIGTLALVSGIDIEGMSAQFQMFNSAVRTGNSERYDDIKSELGTSIPAKKTELETKLSEVNQRIADAEASGTDTSELEDQKNKINANINTLDRMLAAVQATTTEAPTRAGTTTAADVAGESSSKKIKSSDIIIVVVIMVALALIATVMIVIIKRKLDNAALEQSAHATYSNPVYAGPQNGMGGRPANARGSVASVDGEGYLDVAESGGTVPANAPAKKGLVRQESLC